MAQSFNSQLMKVSVRWLAAQHKCHTFVSDKIQYCTNKKNGYSTSRIGLHITETFLQSHQLFE